MIRRFITPTQSSYNVTLELPDDYLGKELEVIVFKKQEGIIEEKVERQLKLSDKYRSVFSKEDAESFNEHTRQMREEWQAI